MRLPTKDEAVVLTGLLAHVLMVLAVAAILFGTAAYFTVQP